MPAANQRGQTQSYTRSFMQVVLSTIALTLIAAAGIFVFNLPFAKFVNIDLILQWTLDMAVWMAGVVIAIQLVGWQKTVPKMKETAG